MEHVNTKKQNKNISFDAFKRDVMLRNEPLFDLSNENKTIELKNRLAEILQLNEPLNKKWNFDDNKTELNLLLAWFCRDTKTFDLYKKEDQNINKDIFLCGVKGSGKSSTIKALTQLIEFLPESKYKKTRTFKFVEQNKMINTFELCGNINKYTYNENETNFDGNPINIVLDDLKISRLTKSFGTNVVDVLIRFLFDRYSIWIFAETSTIITSLLTPFELKAFLPEDLYNRFKHQYNIINFIGEKRT